jgi:hypothetical protein
VALPSAEKRAPVLPLIVGLLLVAAVVFLIWWLLVRDPAEEAAPLVRSGEVALSVERLDFGDVEVGRRSATQRVVLTNATSAAVRIEDVGLDGDAEDDYSIAGDDCVSARLDTGDSCSISVRFEPSEPGARSASLVLSLDGGPGERRVELGGAGAGHPAVVVGPSQLEFGERLLDAKPEVREVSVTGVGSLPVRVSRVAISGDGASAFTPSRRAGCLARRTIEPGESCVVPVAFDPAAPGVRTATLLLAHTGDGSPARVRLHGVGAGAAAPELSPTLVQLGRIDVGSSSSPRTVTVRNGGTATATVAWIAVVSGDAGEFELAGGAGCAAGIELEPGASCTARVRFRPEAAGPRESLLVVASDGRFVEAELRGTGRAPPPEPSPEPAVTDVVIGP